MWRSNLVWKIDTAFYTFNTKYNTHVFNKTWKIELCVLLSMGSTTPSGPQCQGFTITFYASLRKGDSQDNTIVWLLPSPAHPYSGLSISGDPSQLVFVPWPTPPTLSPPSSYWLRPFPSQHALSLEFILYTPTCLWRWDRQSVPKHRHINFRRWAITQKKAYNIQYMAKVWNQDYFTIMLKHHMQ